MARELPCSSTTTGGRSRKEKAGGGWYETRWNAARQFDTGLISACLVPFAFLYPDLFLVCHYIFVKVIAGG